MGTLMSGGSGGSRRTLTQEVADAGHAFAEVVNRFPEDIRLHRAGFKIAHRPNGKEALWEKYGKLWAHSRALESLSESNFSKWNIDLSKRER